MNKIEEKMGAAAPETKTETQEEERARKAVEGVFEGKKMSKEDAQKRIGELQKKMEDQYGGYQRLWGLREAKLQEIQLHIGDAGFKESLKKAKDEIAFIDKGIEEWRRQNRAMEQEVEKMRELL